MKEGNMRIIQLEAGLQCIATALDLAKNTNFETVTLADFVIEKADEVAKICNDKFGGHLFHRNNHGRVSYEACTVYKR